MDSPIFDILFDLNRDIVCNFLSFLKQFLKIKLPNAVPKNGVGELTDRLLDLVHAIKRVFGFVDPVVNGGVNHNRNVVPAHDGLSR